MKQVNYRKANSRNVIIIAVALTICAGVSGFVGSANADEYYMDTNSIGGPCSDSNPGTITQPWRTIGKANSITGRGYCQHQGGDIYQFHKPSKYRFLPVSQMVSS